MSLKDAIHDVDEKHQAVLVAKDAVFGVIQKMRHINGLMPGRDDAPNLRLVCHEI